MPYPEKHKLGMLWYCFFSIEYVYPYSFTCSPLSTNTRTFPSENISQREFFFDLPNSRVKRNLPLAGNSRLQSGACHNLPVNFPANYEAGIVSQPVHCFPNGWESQSHTPSQLCSSEKELFSNLSAVEIRKKIFWSVVTVRVRFVGPFLLDGSLLLIGLLLSDGPL